MPQKTFESQVKKSLKRDMLANDLFRRIRDDLDPYRFSLEEILEEGLDGVLQKNFEADVAERTRKKRVDLILKLLIQQDKVERSDEKGYYRLTEPNLHER